LISREGNKVRVEQKGEMGFFFYKEPVAMLLDVHEEPPNAHHGARHRGQHQGSRDPVRAALLGRGVQARLRGTLHPGLFHTPAHRHAIMNRLIERRFRAMVNEIQAATLSRAPRPSRNEKRAALSRRPSVLRVLIFPKICTGPAGRRVIRVFLVEPSESMYTDWLAFVGAHLGAQLDVLGRQIRKGQGPS